FEVGFFARSLDERPKIYGNIDRRILPVCIGADSPSTLDYLQAIKVDEDQIVKVPTQATGAGLPGGSSNPVFTLLANISETADAVLGKRGGAGGGVSKQDEQWRQKLTTSAARLNNSIQAYLESRVSSETYPERKIVVHCDTPPVIGATGVDLSPSRIDLVGNTFQVFGFPEERSRTYNWNDFIKKMPTDMSGTWSEGSGALLENALHGSKG